MTNNKKKRDLLDVLQEVVDESGEEILLKVELVERAKVHAREEASEESDAFSNATEVIDKITELLEKYNLTNLMTIAVLTYLQESTLNYVYDTMFQEVRKNKSNNLH